MPLEWIMGGGALAIILIGGIAVFSLTRGGKGPVPAVGAPGTGPAVSPPAPPVDQAVETVAEPAPQPPAEERPAGATTAAPPGATEPGSRPPGARGADPTVLDILWFGNPADERAHAFTSDSSDVIQGGFDLSARRLLPRQPPDAYGGAMTFTMACDPRAQNYITLKLWGSEFGEKKGRLFLFLDGKQVGHRHLGDIDPFDIATDDPACPGRFFYTTLPLPPKFTMGKTRVPVEVRARGQIYAYGTTYEQFQQKQDEPTRGIYAAYTHTDGFFVPPALEKQGTTPADPPVRTKPGEERLEELKGLVNKSLSDEFTYPPPPGLDALKFIARAYHVPWTIAYQKPEALREVVRGIDDVAQAHNKNPDGVKTEWASYGAAGDAIRLLSKPLRTVPAEEPIDDGRGGKAPRRELWSQALQASRDYRRAHRAFYTAQTMITDLNIYLANRGLQVVDPPRALPEEQARRYLYEAMGILPWLGNDRPDGGSERRMGEDFFAFTGKGLSRELGYVGFYGEIDLGWGLQILEATEFQDAKIREQLLKLARARSYFRHPSMDMDGHRAMRLVAVIGWRDYEYPGRVLYGMETGRERSALSLAASLQDPMDVGFAQQMLTDGQFFASFDFPHLGQGLVVRTMQMYVPGEYETVRKLPVSAERLPMTPGQPDCAFADEENGVVALKRGDEILYTSLYWRARYAVNYLARVHHITPGFERLATVREDAQFTPRGNDYTRDDRVDWDFRPDFAPRGETHQALAGEQLPVAQEPPGVQYDPRQENHYSGRAEFYSLRYGPYLIGMNTTKDRTFVLKAPEGIQQAPELISGKKVNLTGPLPVPPRSTVVLNLEGDER